jgi:hypothetical protein
LGLRRAGSPAAADRLFLGWCFLFAAVTVCGMATRPPSNHGLLFLTVSAVLLAYWLTALPLSRQMLLGLSFSIAALCAARHAGVTLPALGAAYAVSNVIGAATSGRLNHSRRQLYLGALREAGLRVGLEAALAEVRTLRGLLCICAWCKRVRDEGQAWQPVEAYVESRTHAAFSHGICPECIQTQIGAVAPGGS